MSVDHLMANFHASDPPSELIKSSKEACTHLGFSHNWSETETNDGLHTYKTSFHDRTISLTFDFGAEIQPNLVLLVNFREHLSPSYWEKNNHYREFFDASINLLCELSTILNSEYVGLLSESEYDTIVPSNSPIYENIDKISRIGIYSESLLQDFGGLAGLFEEPRWEYPQPPWRVGELDDGSLLVITHPKPWIDGGWTESSYLDLRAGEEYF